MLWRMKNIVALLTLIFTMTFVISPALTSPFSGFRADQLPFPQIEPPIQPAGYAFAIWGLIYGWLIISAIFGVWKRPSDGEWNRARSPLLLSLAVGTPWLAVANASAVWATILIFVMAAGAIVALFWAPKKDIWLFRVPIGIYAGWLTAASFVSLGSTAAGYGLLTDPLGWAYIGIICALCVAAFVMLCTGSDAYGLTVVWALTGIIVANGMTTWTVTALAAAGIIVLVGLILTTRPTGRPVPS
jgi:hypothetical protein